MADFWGGVAKGFSPSYESALARREKEEERKKKKKDAAKLLKKQRKYDEEIASKKKESISQQLEAEAMGQTGQAYVAPGPGLQGYYGKGAAERTVRDEEFERKQLQERKKLTQAAAMEGVTGATPFVEGEAWDMELVRRTGEQKRAHAKKIAEDAAAAAKALKKAPTSADLAKLGSQRKVAQWNFNRATPEVQDRFFSGIDIEDASPAILEEINDRISAAEKVSKRMTDSYWTGVQVAKDIKIYRKGYEKIASSQREGEEVDLEELDANIELGDQLVYQHSARGVYPPSLKGLMANAPKRVTGRVLEGVTRFHLIANRAEEIAEDINFLKGPDGIGEEKMKKFIGVIDDPIKGLLNMVGVFDKSPEAEAMRRLHQKVAALKNTTLKLRSGMAVTESEAERFLKEFADPKREDYFRALNAFASNTRTEARDALKVEMEAGYVFNKNLRDSVFGVKPKGAESKLNALESQRYKQLQAMDQKLFNAKQRTAFETLKKKAGD